MKAEFLSKPVQKLWPAMVMLVKTSLPSLFSMLWPLMTILLFGREIWGECVEAWLYLQVSAIFIAWGNRQFLLKKFDLMPKKMDEIFSESFWSRSVLFFVFILFAITAPFSWQFRLAAVIYTLARFITNSFDPVLEYRKKYLSSILAEILGFVKGSALLLSFNGPIVATTVLFCLALGELVKAILIVLLVREVKIRFGWKYFSPAYYIQSFPYFIYAFAIVVSFLAERVYVYTQFPATDKAFYQVLMNMLVFIIGVPGFLLAPFLKNYYRGKLRLNSNIRFSVLIGGFSILPVLLIICFMILRLVYRFEISWNFIFPAIFFCFPAFVYSPIFFYLVGKNQQFIIATACFIVVGFEFLIGPFLIGQYGLEGGLVTAAAGQWGLMTAFMILYFQERSAKKIRLIK